MSKITIVSRGDQALLIDISGCTSFKEAIEQLSTTFLSGNQFWQEQPVELDLGSLLLSKAQAAQIIALVEGVGAQPKQIFARSASTFAVLEELQIAVTKEQSDAALLLSIVPEEIKTQEYVIDNSSTSPAENRIGDKHSNSLTNSEPNEQYPAAGVKIEKVIVFAEDQQTAKADEFVNPQLLTEVNALASRENLLNKSPNNEGKSETKKKNPLYLRQTLRAGQAVSHEGDLIIIGDVNAGAEVMAEGDITIWGSLRGIAHAGIDGNIKAEIRALRLQPIQIRIANYIARSPDNGNAAASQSSQVTAEIAKLVNDKIRIVHKTFDG